MVRKHNGEPEKENDQTAIKKTVIQPASRAHINETNS